MIGKKSKIFVAGHNGMVGSAILRNLKRKKLNLLTVSKDKLDLRVQNDVEEWLGKHNVLQYIDEITFEKPRAEHYIDDRAIYFNPKTGAKNWENIKSKLLWFRCRF